ncbi:hypothetical protein [Candidatus Phytoplasma sacchari]|nr:hypothetical protein [Candidatus Phytoplasma sacchari]KAB8122666.1 hypothetical protein F2B49_01125 [Candidatus Phytoplasma sacchari]
MQNEKFWYTKKGITIIASVVVGFLAILLTMCYYFRWWPFPKKLNEKTIKKFEKEIVLKSVTEDEVSDADKAEKVLKELKAKNSQIGKLLEIIEKHNKKSKDDKKIKDATIEAFNSIVKSINELKVEKSSYVKSDFKDKYNSAADSTKLSNAFASLKSDLEIK